MKYWKLGPSLLGAWDQVSDFPYMTLKSFSQFILRFEAAGIGAWLLGVLLLVTMLPHVEAEELREQVILAQLADEPSLAVEPASAAPDEDVGASAEPETNVVSPQPHSPTVPSAAAPSWLDAGHGFVTERADDLTQWFDAYFGGSDSEETGAYSRLRLRLTNDWDERLGNNVRVGLGGKVNLPEISKRLDLVFRGDEPLNDINGSDDPSQSRVALELKVNRFEDNDVDFKLTLGASSNGPKPGIKFTYKRDLSERNSLRFIERVQFDFGDGTTSTSRLLLDHQIDDQQLIRSYSSVLYGSSTDGVEMSTALQWINFWRADRSDGGPAERGLMAYAEVWGATEPYSYVSNYRLGFRFRRQTYRDYLFIEFEPSYNLRVDEPYDPRAWAWRVELRFEFLLFQDLRKDQG